MKLFEPHQTSRVGTATAFSRAVLAYFDWEMKKYLHPPFEEPMEVASFIEMSR
jgi:predicted DNA-binding protein with PD1-like motif